MEAEIRLKRWKYLTWLMEECGRQLYADAAELDELCGKLREMGGSPCGEALIKKLQIQCEGLQEQAEKLGDMKTVLERAERLYENCEERILQTGQEKGKRFEETLRTAELKQLAQIKVVLK